jgi:hypothetical protein
MNLGNLEGAAIDPQNLTKGLLMGGSRKDSGKSFNYAGGAQPNI